MKAENYFIHQTGFSMFLFTSKKSDVVSKRFCCRVSDCGIELTRARLETANSPQSDEILAATRPL